jgi:CTP synthase
VLGLCLGLQCMVIEYSRNKAGLPGASSSEFDPDTEFPVIATMAEQVEIIDHGDLGGTMRLGLYEAALEPGSIVSELYGAPTAAERHRHRYEVNNHYRDRISEAGLVFSGVSPDRSLVEYVELPREVHPFYVGTQAHPELRSRPNRAHPLFRGLIAAALERSRASRLFEVAEPGALPGEGADPVPSAPRLEAESAGVAEPAEV